MFVAHLTGTIPAFFLLTGAYAPVSGYALLVAGAAGAALVVSLVLGGRGIPHAKPAMDGAAVPAT